MSLFSNLNKPRFYLFALLAFCVVSSKKIIIYNEETLVALSFISFILFVFYYFGDTIKESLNERGQVIQAEFENLLVVKENSSLQLLQEHQRVGGLSNRIQEVQRSTRDPLFSLGESSKKGIVGWVSQQMSHKFKTLLTYQNQQETKGAPLMAENVIAAVCLPFYRNKGTKKSRNLSPAQVKKTIKQVKTVFSHI